ncbi:hypothetical protein HBB16_19450 [Pseudonocardia sp. MCCB 268]|nr:hypothetical protein [Pseudonocardia cytotoxica]
MTDTVVRAADTATVGPSFRRPARRAGGRALLPGHPLGGRSHLRCRWPRRTKRSGRSADYRRRRFRARRRPAAQAPSPRSRRPDRGRSCLSRQDRLDEVQREALTATEQARTKAAGPTPPARPRLPATPRSAGLATPGRRRGRPPERSEAVTRSRGVRGRRAGSHRSARQPGSKPTTPPPPRDQAVDDARAAAKRAAAAQLVSASRPCSTPARPNTVTARRQLAVARHDRDQASRSSPTCGPPTTSSAPGTRPARRDHRRAALPGSPRSRSALEEPRDRRPAARPVRRRPPGRRTVH